MKKKITRVLSIVMLMSCLIPSTFALDYPPSSTLEVSVTGAYNVTAHSTFSWSTQSANYLNSNSNLTGEHTSLEHRARTSGDKQNVMMGVQTSKNYYTTLPNPYYDNEDDDKNGWYEESEVTVGGTIVANKSYVFSSFYSKDSSVTAGIVQLNGQMSWLNRITDEWNTTIGSSETLKYQRWGNSRSIEEPSLEQPDYEDVSKQFVGERITTQDKLDSYVQEVYSAYESLNFDHNSRTYQTKLVEGTITFSEPITMDELQLLLDSAEAEVVEFQAKFINAEGDWCTFGGHAIDEAEMIEAANKVAEYYGSPHTSYEGIVCAQIIFNSDNYEMIKQSDAVYFLDMSKEIYKQNNPEVNTSIYVPGYAWELAEFLEG